MANLILKEKIKELERTIDLMREQGYVGCIASIQRSILELEAAIRDAAKIDERKKQALK